jgi:hypothetical protein
LFQDLLFQDLLLQDLLLQEHTLASSSQVSVLKSIMVERAQRSTQLIGPVGHGAKFKPEYVRMARFMAQRGAFAMPRLQRPVKMRVDFVCQISVLKRAAF